MPLPTAPLATLQRPAGPPVARLTFGASVELTLLCASLFWLLTGNRLFLGAALQGCEWSDPSAWGFGLALGTMLLALHFVMLALVANRWTVKPVLAVMFVATAFATYFMEHFGVYLDPSMLRNALRTDGHEARELFSWALVPHLLLYAALPLAVLWRVRIVHRPWRRAAIARSGSLLVAAAASVGALLAVFQPFSSLTRNHKEVRYLIAPANFLWSLGAVLVADARGATAPRQPIGLDATPGPIWRGRTKPVVLVLVIGETARAANWGLNGYARQTTPQLARLPVLNFPQVTSCGTNTEVSLPCMFAPVGRRNYNEARIRGSESLLHVLAHAGMAVHWRDNQSGCKGVCAGLPNDSVQALNPAGLCEGGGCLDEGLLQGIDDHLQSARGAQVLVLHQLGNHGPSYFRRYPKAFERFQPACNHDDLRTCSQQEIVNAYDNALLYTDHLLAQLINRLQASAVDSALVYLSDHGESLGENNLFLHGVPYAIAPKVQTRVPMVMWLSDGLRRTLALDAGCLQRRATQPASHDHLFHTVLGLMDVETALYEPAWDLAHGCRAPVAQVALR